MKKNRGYFMIVKTCELDANNLSPEYYAKKFPKRVKYM